jgi:hydroxyacylglutathione hydrolase
LIVGKRTLKIEPLPALRDNYIWVLHKSGCRQVTVVDPGDAMVVCNYLQNNLLVLDVILVTHHHHDHTAGINDLLNKYPEAAVYGPAGENIKGVRTLLREGDNVELDNLECCLEVMDVPGHTAGHIAYYLPGDESPAVFCGDTLFSAGCGRLFDGTASQLYDSLQKLCELPGNTSVYCAHEYTLNNIEFAQRVTPCNTALSDYARQVKQLRMHGLPSLPVTIKQERAINPFLRVNTVDVIKAVEEYSGEQLTGPRQIFTQLRKWKDVF